MSEKTQAKTKPAGEAWHVEDWAGAIVRKAKPATMTPVSRIYNLAKAVEHLCQARVAGDLVECGVWRGGSLMTMALALLHCGDGTRRLYGFDTFAGMTQAGPNDQLIGGPHFNEIIAKGTPGQRELYTAKAPLELVQENLASTGFPKERLELVVGDVLQTLPDQAPEQIALLRLDTDFYASTKHELETLYPRLVEGGILLIDDYGCFRGSKEATDEYFATIEQPPLLWAIDNHARAGIKPPAPLLY
jgi:predicted O-methyltransferase YrrM